MRVSNGPGPRKVQDEANLRRKDERNDSHNDLQRGLAQVENGEGCVDEPALSKPWPENRGFAFKALSWLDGLLVL